MASDDGGRKRERWALTADTFDRLLAALDPDRERAAVAYERLRHRVIGLLRWWGASASEELADETLDRVARKLAEGAPVPEGSLAPYVRGVARMVLYESNRQRVSPLGGPEPAAPPPDAANHAADCLDYCLDAWDAVDRSLLLRYYGSGRAADVRREIAGELGITVGALRIRMHRLRIRLETCVSTCLERRQ